MTKKQYKKKIGVAVLSVLTLALALTSATYAWFASSASATVKQLDLTVTSASKLEISASKDEGYSQTLKYEDIAEYLKYLNSGDDAQGLNPVSTIDLQKFFSAFQYGENGLVTAFSQAQSDNRSYLAMPIWLRCDQDMDVYLGSKTSVAVTEASDITQFFDRAVRIGFKSDAEAVIYEPNPAKEGFPGRRSTTAANDGEGKGVQSIEPTVIADQPTFTRDQLFAEVAEDGTVNLTGTPQKIAALTGGEPQQVMLYLWMEGMDWDCVDGISGSTLLVDLQFAGIYR